MLIIQVFLPFVIRLRESQRLCYAPSGSLPREEFSVYFSWVATRGRWGSQHCPCSLIGCATGGTYSLPFPCLPSFCGSSSGKRSRDLRLLLYLQQIYIYSFTIIFIFIAIYILYLQDLQCYVLILVLINACIYGRFVCAYVRACPCVFHAENEGLQISRKCFVCLCLFVCLLSVLSVLLSSVRVCTSV